MPKFLNKINKNKGLILPILFIVFQGHAFAQLEDPLSFASVFDFLGRTLNFILGLAGIIFAIMFFVGAIKYALALGDPKGLQGAKDTLTLAIVGLFIVLGAFTIITVITGILGVDSSFINNPIDNLRGAVEGFINQINACNKETKDSGCDFGINLFSVTD